MRVLAVPFEEDDKDPSIWFLDHSYLENMFRMFKKVNGTSSKLLAGVDKSSLAQLFPSPILRRLIRIAISLVQLAKRSLDGTTRALDCAKPIFSSKT